MNQLNSHISPAIFRCLKAAVRMRAEIFQVVFSYSACPRADRHYSSFSKTRGAAEGCLQRALLSILICVSSLYCVSRKPGVFHVEQRTKLRSQGSSPIKSIPSLKLLQYVWLENFSRRNTESADQPVCSFANLTLLKLACACTCLLIERWLSL